MSSRARLSPRSCRPWRRAARWDAHKGNDDFKQAGDLYRLLSPEERERLTSNIAGAMRGVDKAILAPNIEHFKKCDPEYGRKIAEKAGLAAKK